MVLCANPGNCSAQPASIPGRNLPAHLELRQQRRPDVREDVTPSSRHQGLILEAMETRVGERKRTGNRTESMTHPEPSSMVRGSRLLVISPLSENSRCHQSPTNPWAPRGPTNPLTTRSAGQCSSASIETQTQVPTDYCSLSHTHPWIRFPRNLKSVCRFLPTYYHVSSLILSCYVTKRLYWGNYYSTGI